MDDIHPTPMRLRNPYIFYNHNNINNSNRHISHSNNNYNTRRLDFDGIDVNRTNLDPTQIENTGFQFNVSVSVSQVDVSQSSVSHVSVSQSSVVSLEPVEKEFAVLLAAVSEPNSSVISSQKLEQELYMMIECVICRTNKKKFAFINCGHLCVCHSCIPCNNKCPLCRKVSTAVIPIFY